MPGLKAPADYKAEPWRHPHLVVNSKEPFNAEPKRSDLISSYVTPVDFFYKRNHGPIPLLDDIDRYSVSITGLIEKPKELVMKDIWKLPKYTVTCTLQISLSLVWFHCPISSGEFCPFICLYLCPSEMDDLTAGNRRTAMSKTRKVKGVGWNVSAVGNAVWGGAKLADVLELVGISKFSNLTQSGGKHVEFVSVDKCKEENGGPYKASIPISQATHPEADVLLAYEMNGQTLNRDHGYPLRVIVPGVIGARSVKWLESINIIAEECQGFFMQKDYKMFPPTIDWGNIDWSTRRPQMDYPVQSAICSLDDINIITPGKITIKGYALSGGGRGIERVDISVDGGRTWMEATRSQKPGIPYISDAESSDRWAWVLFEAEANISQNTDIIAKAVDAGANAQPENVETIWNLRGILNNSWHRIRVNIIHSKL